jgi:transcriptional regulator
MLVHPWDAAEDTEWRDWLSGHDFGQLVDDPASKAALLEKQLRHFETDGARAPVSAASESPDRRLLPGIRGIEFTITGVRAKFKFGGNKTAEDRERIGAHLAERDGRLDAEALTQLRRRG